MKGLRDDISLKVPFRIISLSSKFRVVIADDDDSLGSSQLFGYMNSSPNFWLVYVFQVAVGSDVGVDSGRVDVVVVLGVGRKRAASTPNKIPKRIRANETNKGLLKDVAGLVCGFAGSRVAKEVGKRVVEEDGGGVVVWLVPHDWGGV